MDIKLDRNNRLPVHAQLKAQLTYLIQSGQLKAGIQLPTVRQLAGYLRVNRNTAAKVFAEMQREGHITCEPGRGSFVAPKSIQSKSKVERMQKLLTVVDGAIDRASRLGFSAEELFLTLYARTQATPAEAGFSRPVAALFTECSRGQLDLWTSEIRRDLSIPVDSMLVEEFKDTVQKTPGALKRYDIVITTFYHIREVTALLSGTEIETVALMVDTSLETLMRLTSLPEGTTVGVACADRTGAENMRLSIQRAGLSHLRVVLGCGDEKGNLEKMLAKAAVVVCSSLIEESVRKLAAKDTEILVDHNRLDRSGIEMLRARLAEISSGEPGREGPRKP
jgi:DNA-binding transcriptional regulator YhcF (GntR family)